MNEYVNQAMVMFQKMIAAATPVAQKAWEISLLTLQIDALSEITKALFCLILGVVGLWWSFKKLRPWANRVIAEDAGNPCAHMFMGFVFMSSVAALVNAITVLIDLWLWVKLFKPELWLAHEAIQAVVSKLVK